MLFLQNAGAKVQKNHRTAKLFPLFFLCRFSIIKKVYRSLAGSELYCIFASKTSKAQNKCSYKLNTK